MKAARQAWFDGQLELEPQRLIFLDECGTNTKMARLYGRSKRGERCRAAIPHGHWKTTTLVAGLSTDGIIAPMIMDGAMPLGECTHSPPGKRWRNVLSLRKNLAGALSAAR